MADQNPWASESHNTHQQNPNQQSQQQYGSAGGNYPQQRFYETQNQQQQQHQQYSQSDYSSPTQHNSSYSSDPSYNSYQPPSSNPWSDAPTSNPPLPARHPNHNFAQSQSQQTPSFGAPTRRDTDDLLASQPDRAEQVEHLQAYEATANQSQEDRDRAALEKEFPDVDGSLIAALYGDTKDLSATREMLQELGRQ